MRAAYFRSPLHLLTLLFISSLLHVVDSFLYAISLHMASLHVHLHSPHSASCALDFTPLHIASPPLPITSPRTTCYKPPMRAYEPCQTIPDNCLPKTCKPEPPSTFFMPPHRYEHKVALQNAQRHCLPTASFPNPCHLADKIFVSEAVQVSRIDAGIFKMVTHIMQFGFYGPQALSTGVCHLCQANICSKKRIPCSLHISIFLIRQEAICTICD